MPSCSRLQFNMMETRDTKRACVYLRARERKKHERDCSKFPTATIHTDASFTVPSHCSSFPKTYTYTHICACVYSQSFHCSITIAIAIRHKPTLVPNHESLTALLCFCCGRYSLLVVARCRCLLSLLVAFGRRGVVASSCICSFVCDFFRAVHPHFTAPQPVRLDLTFNALAFGNDQPQRQQQRRNFEDALDVG